MSYATIYRYSKCPDFGFGNNWSRLEGYLDKDEYYLFRTKWGGSESTGKKQVDENFVKVVNQDWIDDHPTYYNCDVMDDEHPVNGYYTEYGEWANTGW